MNDAESEFDEEEFRSNDPGDDVITPKKQLSERCSAADIALIEDTRTPNEEPTLRLGIKCGRNTRWLILWSDESIREVLSIPFEKYTFLSDLEAICSYGDGTIEAGVRPIGINFASNNYLFRRLFGVDRFSDGINIEAAKIVLSATQEGQPDIEIGPASEVFHKLARSRGRRGITLKISGCRVTTHDAALTLLNKAAGSIFSNSIC